jgi:methionine-rich copper-binding protein CopC
MKIRAVIAASLLVVAVTAHAHTHLEGSTPADKSRVAAPKAIELHFSAAARLTALSLQQGSAAAKSLAPLPAKATKDVSIALPALGAGDYVVTWRVAGDDGHVMSGKFGFTVDPAAAPAAAKSPMAMPMHDHEKMEGHMDEHMKNMGDARKTDAPADKHEH